MTFGHFYDNPKLSFDVPAGGTAYFKHTVYKCARKNKGAQHMAVDIKFSPPYGNAFKLDSLDSKVVPVNAMTNRKRMMAVKTGMWRYNPDFCVKGNRVSIQYWYKANPQLIYTAEVEIID